jgi:hypothetical protein
MARTPDEPLFFFDVALFSPLDSGLVVVSIILFQSLMEAGNVPVFLSCLDRRRGSRVERLHSVFVQQT